MKCLRFSTFATAVSLAFLATAAISQAAGPNPATTPASRAEVWWQQRHESMNARVKKGNVDLIFLGDSITHAWESVPDLWNKHYGNRNAVNLGISGDQTCHVLWRLDHGNIDGISPKLAVVMIGTNNAGGGQPAELVAEGVKAVVEKLRAKLPQTKVLLLAIFPRGEDNNNRLRKVNTAANKIIANLADNQMVFFLDIGGKFLDADGRLSKDIMPDALHPNAKGYAIWAEAIEPTVAKLMGEK